MSLRKWQRALDWLICLIILSYPACLLLSRSDNWTLPSWGILFPIGALVISLVVLFNTYLHAPNQEKRFWGLIFLGLLVSVAGFLTWAYHGIVLGSSYPQAGFPLLLMGAGLGIELGALYYLLNRRNFWTEVSYGLEIFIAMAVGIALSWYFIIHPALTQPQLAGLNLALFILYSLLDLGLLLAALGLIYMPHRVFPGTVWTWLLFHLTILLAGNSAYLYLAVHDPLYAGSFNQPVWALAYLFLVPAAMNYMEYSLEVEDSVSHALLVEGKPDYLRILLPYACLILLVIIMFNTDKNINSLEVLGVGVLLLIVGRQIFTLTGHRSMLTKILNQTGELELQAQRRAEELYQKNAQLQTALEDIQHLAYYDVLTNLPNRRFFLNKLTESLVRANRNNHMLAVLFIDLDSFKLINDTMGHSFGDLLLKDIGEKIMNCIRDTDIVSRQGGDEFTVLLDQIASIDEAKRWIEEIQLRIQDAFVINEIEVHVAASIGVALYPRHGDDMDSLIKYSDIAMFKAKELGKNQYAIYTADMNQVFMRRMSLDKELRSAIQNEELSLYYQPQINIASGAIIGIESLVRWNS
ncbi:MAG: diguanylate cyclase, partial [Firmicutes bacterium]|nr:diguanylate cyclase [Bacillota bacterium]